MNVEKISFDSGIKEYRINGTGVLRFNPADPNVYARFLEAVDKIQDMEKTLTEQARQLEDQDSGIQAVKLLAQADKQMKELLSWVFGEKNCFDKLLGGVNLLAVAENGQRVITNLLEALQPVLVAGAERCAKEVAQAAVAKAKTRRAKQ